MGRDRVLDPCTPGPPAVCDVCGKRACTLDQAGIVCYHCGRGVFMHRRFWEFQPCAFCTMKGNFDCPHCLGKCVVARPKECIDIEDLRAEWRRLPERYLRCGQEVPSVIAERAGWASVTRT